MMNIRPTAFDYPHNKHYVLGPKYALLRKEFQNVPLRQPTQYVKDVLLSTGGADSEHTALGCVQYLREQAEDGITYHVVLGGTNQDVAEIERLTDGGSHCVTSKRVGYALTDAAMRCGDFCWRNDAV